jgi:pantothenate kinase-related protein Tda10
MKTYMVANGLAYDHAQNDDLHTKEQWGVAITSLQAKLDSLGTDTQQKMVFVQDFMGQYNSYLQGANSVIQQSNQTLGELARSR